MKDNNNTYDFEHFLRTSIDDFKMIPSRKIWYGIYNNMHPDRKWPSIAVCLLILSAIMFVGVANNNSISNAARRNAAENLLATHQKENIKTNTNAADNTIALAQNFSTSLSVNNTSSINNTQIIVPNNTTAYIGRTNTTAAVNTVALTITENNIAKPNNTTLAEENTLLLTDNTISTLPTKNNTKSDNIGKVNNAATAATQNNIVSTSNESNEDVANNITTKTTAGNTNLTAITENIANEKAIVKSTNDIAKNTVVNINEEKSWKEDYAFRNKPAKTILTHLKERGSISYYVTPSIGYRNISTLRESKLNYSAASFVGTNTTTVDASALNNLKDVSALNLEAGVAYLYNLSDNLRLKAGVQANYTNYISKVIDLGHAAQTSLAVSGSQNTTRSSTYITTEGNTNLNKTTWQIALPLGADIKIAEFKKLKWYIGGTIQPTYIFSGSGYVLSADAKNYITEPSLLRKFNLNTAVESFISFKPSSTVTFYMGPQFRYQLLSTYKSTYNFSEKLYNLGVKVGISTRF
jgi:hypothetical protein